MGGTLSKRSSMQPDRQASGGGSSSNGHNVNGGGASLAETGVQYTAELSYYEQACRIDPEIRSFDSTLQQRTTHAISTLALGAELRSLSFNTLKEVTGCLFETNNEVVDAILKCKEDVWKNPELFDLVKDYFDCSIKTLDYCTELEKCLKKARDSHLIIQFALQHFEEEEDDKEKDEVAADGNGKKKYTMTLEKLRQFKNNGSPFTEEFSKVFQSVYSQQQLMLTKLLLRKKKLDKKLKSITSWRKMSNIIFVAALMGVIICSVVAAAIAAPPVAAALAAVSSIPIGSTGKWINSLLKKYEEAVGAEKELLTSMQFGTWIALKDLDTIRVVVDNMEVHFNSLLENTDFALRHEEAVKFAIEEIKKKLDVFLKDIEDLGKEVDRCSRNIRKARTVVLQRIIKHPNI
ncbi:UPF0496 protein 1-like [Canna indica]|uniref:UPF0496 protein 1-like n=1 Tax=Canna indica TaxID=4628 RepID=A0AAQ3Q481_9LILI|nr:UPF0496 protein 1-like [Canna indica]